MATTYDVITKDHNYVGNYATKSEAKAAIGRAITRNGTPSNYYKIVPIKEKRQKNPSLISSNDTDWIPVHAIRRCANGDIQILTEKGTLSNPGKKKKILGKLKGLFSAGAKAVGLRNPNTWGTSYFTSLNAAIRYYHDYGDDINDVKRKIAEGSIHIGKPPKSPGQRITTIDGGKRYAITES